MSIYRVHYDASPWGTVVVRAASEAEAILLGQDVGEQYTDSREGVTIELLDPEGPAAVLVEDWS